MRQLLLHARHEVSGAVFVDRAGWEVPSGYSDFDGEVGAVRTGAGVIDLSDRMKIRVSGPDRVSFLQGVVTQDIEGLRPGQRTYALTLNAKGKVVGDLWVYALGDAFLLDLLADESGWVLEHIRKHLVSDDVALEPLPAVAHLGLHGPLAPALLRRVIRDTAPPGPATFLTFPVDRKRSVLIAASDWFFVPGYAFISWTDSLDDVWRTVTQSGPPNGPGARPVGREAWNTLRIEAGRPRAGVDMDEDTIALEARMEPAISFTKGCYVGQEVIARATYQGHMNRLLVGFRIEGDSVPRHGDAVTVAGEKAGFVTSGTYSPTLRSVIAMGYVRRPNDALGTRVVIETDGWKIRGSVARLPFVGPR